MTSTTAAAAEPRTKLPLAVIIVSLLVLGGLLFFAVDKLMVDLGGPASGVRSGLHAAAASGDTDAVRSAIARGEDVDAVQNGADNSGSGRTPLLEAVAAGQTEAAKMLLEAGAAPEARTRDGKSALMLAAGWSDTPMVEMLLAADARLDARSDLGWTALMLAASRGRSEAVQTLVSAGADVQMQNKWDQTALLVGCASGVTGTIEPLLNAGSDVNAADEFGMTPLIAAAEHIEEPSVVVQLLDAGAQVNAADENGITALMKAADRADLELVRVLVERGATRAQTDSQGRTAADWAEGRDDDLGQQVAAFLRGG
ncbi:MAG: ankyrin repeat domain-containing protein [Planctomycetota bacterium]